MIFLIFYEFSLFVENITGQEISAERRRHKGDGTKHAQAEGHRHIKIHEATTDVITPLLNLNLNYEKLRREDSDFFQSHKSNPAQFGIIQHQYLLPIVVKCNPCLEIRTVS